MTIYKQSIERLSEFPEKLVRGTLLDLASIIIENTPVDTGRLKGNWQASFDSPKKSTIDRTDKTRGKGVSSAAAKAEIDKYQPGQTFFLTNNLPYAYAIEIKGSRTTGPGDLLRKPVANLQRIVNERLAKER